MPANQRPIKVICPKCKAESQYMTYSSINVTDLNGYKEKVKDGSFFLHKCPKCEQAINVEYPFLYHQIEDHFMIHYTMTDENTKAVIDMLSKPDDAHKKMVQDLIDNNYLIRIVRTKAQLLEKITIYDEGLDDRIIEIAKAVSATKFLRDNKDVKIGQIYFAVSDDEGRILYMYSEDNKPIAKSYMTDEFYQRVASDFLPKLPPLRDDRNIIVNAGWATGFLKSLQGEQ